MLPPPNAPALRPPAANLGLLPPGAPVPRPEAGDQVPPGTAEQTEQVRVVRKRVQNLYRKQGRQGVDAPCSYAAFVGTYMPQAARRALERAELSADDAPYVASAYATSADVYAVFTRLAEGRRQLPDLHCALVNPSDVSGDLPPGMRRAGVFFITCEAATLADVAAMGPRGNKRARTHAGMAANAAAAEKAASAAIAAAAAAAAAEPRERLRVVPLGSRAGRRGTSGVAWGAYGPVELFKLFELVGSAEGVAPSVLALVLALVSPQGWVALSHWRRGDPVNPGEAEYVDAAVDVDAYAEDVGIGGDGAL